MWGGRNEIENAQLPILSNLECAGAVFIEPPSPLLLRLALSDNVKRKCLCSHTRSSSPIQCVVLFSLSSITPSLPLTSFLHTKISQMQRNFIRFRLKILARLTPVQGPC